MRIAFVENRDSFTWNLVEALPFARSEIDVTDVARCDLEHADALVIGPGPLDPVRAGLMPLVQDAARRGLPTLGICLGHQAIGLAFGSQLMRVGPVHGRQDPVIFRRSRVFGEVGTIDAMRYHSLAVTSVRPPLVVTAATGDGVVMALEHDTLPMAGLQFHPDSYATPRGQWLVEAFFRSVL